MKDKGKTIEQVLAEAKLGTKDFIKELEAEERVERLETPEMLEAEIKGDKINTIRKKHAFIDEMKSGLGDAIKENPNRVTFVKKPWHVRFRNWLSRVFTKF